MTHPTATNTPESYAIIERHRALLHQLADDVGSAYVYDLDAMRSVAGELKKYLSPCRILYSMKANPLQEVVRALAERLDGVEIASGGELSYALSLGINPRHLVFAGPAKSPAEIEQACRHGIWAINAESGRQLKLCQEMKDSGTMIGLRVNTPHGVDAPFDNMVGGPSRFGVDQEDIAGMLANGELAEIDGIHVYSASQIRQSSAIVRQFMASADMFDRLQHQLGRPLNYLNLGGGFGVPHVDSDNRPDLGHIGQAVAEISARFSENSNLGIFLEIGRYLTAENGVLVTTVREVKESRGTVFALADCGYNAFQRPMLTHENHGIVPLDPKAEKGESPVTICGPLCTSTDTFGVVHGWKPRAGEPLAILIAGAYGWSMSPQYFLGHPTPAEAVIEGNSLRVTRARVDARTYMSLGRL